MLTWFNMLDHVSLREMEDVGGHFTVKPAKKATRHRAKPDYTSIFHRPRRRKPRHA